MKYGNHCKCSQMTQWLSAQSSSPEKCTNSSKSAYFSSQSAMASPIKRLKIIFPKPPSPAAKIADNDDLLLQILTRLPVKSLLKFKCVSKHWLSLITSPKFSRHSHSPRIRGLFLDTPPRNFIALDCKHRKTPISSVNYPPHMIISHSCNGLLLCCGVSSRRSAPIYYVCNPTTKQSTALPPLCQIGEIRAVYLAFDPLKSPDYKVISVRQYDSQIQIYSPESGSWRLSEADFGADQGGGMRGGEYWNGGIHWYRDSGNGFYLDVDEEEIKEMPMPNPVTDDCMQRRIVYFGESGGHLNLIEIHDPPATEFDVWELKSDYSGWWLKYRVDLDGLAREYPGMVRDDLDPSLLNYYAFQVFCIVEGEEEEDDSYMVLHIPANIIRLVLE